MYEIKYDLCYDCMLIHDYRIVNEKMRKHVEKGKKVYVKVHPHYLLLKGKEERYPEKIIVGFVIYAKCLRVILYILFIAKIVVMTFAQNVLRKISKLEKKMVVVAWFFRGYLYVYISKELMWGIDKYIL